MIINTTQLSKQLVKEQSGLQDYSVAMSSLNPLLQGVCLIGKQVVWVGTQYCELEWLLTSPNCYIPTQRKM